MALLVGVDQYEKRHFADRPLSYAERDVTVLADVLKQHGFEVRMLKGSGSGVQRATKGNIDAAIAQSLTGRKATDVILLGFAGHGQQMSAGGTEDAFYCPVDAERNEPRSMISLTSLMDKLDDKGGVNLVLVDACRDNPDPGRGTRSISGNELRGRLPVNTAILFSCAAGQKALETKDAGGGHGVFFYHVLEGLRGKARDPETGEVTWSDLAHYVQKNVNKKAKTWFPELATQQPGGLLQTPHQLANLVVPPVIAGKQLEQPISARVPFIPPSVPQASPLPRLEPRPSSASPSVESIRAFKLLDTNGDWSLSEAEISKELRATFRALIASADRNGSGTLDLEEFTTIPESALSESTTPHKTPGSQQPPSVSRPAPVLQKPITDAPKDAVAAFRLLDRNGDWSLIESEIPAERREAFRRLVSLADRNGSGTLDLDEFKKSMQAP